MRKKRFHFLILIAIIVQACSSGQKLLEQGAYDEAVFTAINRLKSNSSHVKAQRSLTEAFGLAVNKHLRMIEQSKNSLQPFKWEEIVYHYEDLNNLSEAVENCYSCQKLVSKYYFYDKELNEAKLKAAEERYIAGKKMLQQNNKSAAREAYYHFEKVNSFMNNYKDSKKLLDDAYYMASIKVLVRPSQIQSNLYKLSNQYFQDELDKYLYKLEQRNFVIFYRAEEVRQQNIYTDQTLTFNFDDFIVGQSHVKEKVEEFSKSDVKIGETNTGRPVYGTVKAKFSTFDINLSSTGLLSVLITDNQTRKVLAQTQLPGTYIWADSWASYTGDARALTQTQLNLTKKRAVSPPPPQQLFLEFTKPILAQTTNYLNSYFGRYK